MQFMVLFTRCSTMWAPGPAPLAITGLNCYILGVIAALCYGQEQAQCFCVVAHHYSLSFCCIPWQLLWFDFLEALVLLFGIKTSAPPTIFFTLFHLQYSYELLLQYLQKTQALVVLGVINEHITFEGTIPFSVEMSPICNFVLYFCIFTSDNLLYHFYVRYIGSISWAALINLWWCWCCCSDWDK